MKKFMEYIFTHSYTAGGFAVAIIIIFIKKNWLISLITVSILFAYLLISYLYFKGDEALNDFKDLFIKCIKALFNKIKESITSDVPDEDTEEDIEDIETKQD